MSEHDETSDAALEQQLARAEAAARRRTLLVAVLFLGAAFGMLYFTAVSVSTARQELAESDQARRKAQGRMQAALDSLHAVNADTEQREQAHEQMHEQSVALSSQQRAHEEELERLRGDRKKLLEAIEKGRGTEVAVSVMLEMVERHQAAEEYDQARAWLDRVLALTPGDALAQRIDGELTTLGH